MTFDWEYTLGLFWYAPLWKATLTVAELSLLSWAIAVGLGFFLALAKLSSMPVIRYSSAIYIWFFRSLPLLVLLIFVYNLPQVVPSTSAVLANAFVAALVSLVLSETAYIAEIHRGGLLSVPEGQREAGRALGVGFFGIQRLIVTPQAIRIALPTLANEFITIVKLTSLASVISMTEILLVGQRLYTQNFKVLETMVAVSVFYVFLVTIFDVLLKQMEQHLDVTVIRRRLTPPSSEEIERHFDRAELERRMAASRDRTGEAATVLEAKGIHKAFGGAEVLKGIDLDVKTGEVVSIIGPSGSGKTTFIRTLNGLAAPGRGEITLSGETLFLRGAGGTGAREVRPTLEQIERIGMVFQHFNLFPHRTALDNVTLGPRYHRHANKRQLRWEGFAMLERVGLLEHAYKYPHELSGGQQQRVAIARALAMNPKVLLFDEPTSALDPELVGEVLQTIEGLARDGLTMVIVTHEMQFAYRISDRVMFMDEGRAVTTGSPGEIFERSTEPRLRRFLKDFRLA